MICLAGTISPRATLTCNKNGKKDSCSLTCSSKARFLPGKSTYLSSPLKSEARFGGSWVLSHKRGLQLFNSSHAQPWSLHYTVLLHLKPSSVPLQSCSLFPSLQPRADSYLNVNSQSFADLIFVVVAMAETVGEWLGYMLGCAVLL